MSEETRLNKFIASQLSLGRRAADDLIVGGKVTVNNAVAKLGARFKPGDVVKVSGQTLSNLPQGFLYLLMNKPVGYVCSRRQQGDTPTIYSLLPAKYQHLKTVGRLDKDSSGLILLTNDGDLAHRLTHPSFTKVKKYQVSLNKPLQPLHHQMINDHGIDLPDGRSKFQLERLKEGDSSKWQVTMHEGRNRQIRRTFLALGYVVTNLHRTQFGPWQESQLGKAKILEVNTPLDH
jgi:23S rRNA pseudouridine2605 synthase